MHTIRYMRLAVAWQNLIHAKTRFLIALSSVSFAVTLMFTQLGFFGAVLKTATSVYDNLNFDIVLMSRKALESTVAQSFPRQRLYQAAGTKGVESVMPFYIAFKQWKNPETKLRRPMLVMGFNLQDKIFRIPEVYKHTQSLQREETLLMSRFSRPEFGQQKVGLKTELGKHRVEVVGFFSMNPSLRTDGIVIMSDTNFIRIYPGRKLDDLSMGLIKLQKNVNVKLIVQQLRQNLPRDVYVLSRDEAETKDQEYWVQSTSVGYIFGLGVISGFMVGAVIVYQVLNADVTEHLHEYTTLKAIGYNNYHLSVIVLQSSFILAILGFVPGLLMSLGIYNLTYVVTKLPVAMTFSRVITVGLLTIFMCGVSALIALRKVFLIDPADVF
jgi:putative ABC transport system permease protein